MLGIPIGLAVANATEWFMHKYVLHGLGSRSGKGRTRSSAEGGAKRTDKASFWSFHWHDHHRNARKNGHVDPDYKEPLLRRWNGQSKEALALVATGAALAPLAPIAPFFVGTMIYCGINYYRQHKRSHLDPEWAREHLPWHYDHHMGPNQHANWCVTRPWFDHVMGTREPYVGTERETRDRARRADRMASAAAL